MLVSSLLCVCLLSDGSNSMKACQERQDQSQEALSDSHQMRKTLVSALKQSSKLPSRRGKVKSSVVLPMMI